MHRIVHAYSHIHAAVASFENLPSRVVATKAGDVPTCLVDWEVGSGAAQRGSCYLAHIKFDIESARDRFIYSGLNIHFQPNSPSTIGETAATVSIDIAAKLDAWTEYSESTHSFGA